MNTQCGESVGNAMKVTSKNFRNLPKGTHRLDRGIYLRVRDKHSGWIFRTQKDGRRFDFSLGGIDQPFDSVRRKALLIQTQIAEGADPAGIMRDRADRRRPSPTEPEAEPSSPTFGEIYAAALDHLEFLRRWKARGTRDAYWRICEKNLLPILGDVPVSDITPKVAADALKPIWTSSWRAIRTQATLRAVMNYAKLQGLIQNNPAEWVGCLDSFLPAPSDLEKGVEARHHSAVSAEELRAIAHKLARRKKSVSARCVLFGLLTVGRLSEYLKAEWDEIDWEEKTLSVPPLRRKDGKAQPFIVPLPDQAMAILDEIPLLNKFIFTEGNKEKPLAPQTPLLTLKRAADSEITLHGCRSTFSDWCARTGKNFLVSEKCLMHAVGGKVFMAYQRDDLIDQRRALLQEWADFLLG